MVTGWMVTEPSLAPWSPESTFAPRTACSSTRALNQGRICLLGDKVWRQF